MCCKILDVPEVKPDPHAWCRHASPGHGCKIYADRPGRCREFMCQWLLDSQWPDYWFPARARIVVTHSKSAKGDLVVGFVVDPAYPLRWREEPWLSDIKRVAAEGLKGGWTTFIIIKGEYTQITP